MAKSKIVKLEVKEPFRGQSSAFIAFEDKAWGIYEYTGELSIKVDDEVEYTLVKEKTKNNKDLTKVFIKLPSPAEAPVSAPQEPSTPAKEPLVPISVANSPRAKEMKFEAMMTLAGHAMTGLCNGKLTRDEAKEFWVSWRSTAHGLIDELFES